MSQDAVREAREFMAKWLPLARQIRGGHPRPVKPWLEHGCCEACWNATEEKCTCGCGGVHHGEGNHREVEG